jgi:hypothetical protein
MIRIASGLLAAALLAGCVLPGYGGLIYVPRGTVALPREDSLEACAASVRAGAKATDPTILGAFQPAPAGPPPNMAGVLGTCLGPDGVMHLILPNEIREGPRILMER